MRSNTVRVVEIDGQPWFAAADVCSVPGYSPPPPAHSTDTSLHNRFVT